MRTDYIYWLAFDEKRLLPPFLLAQGQGGRVMSIRIRGRDELPGRTPWSI